MNINVIPGYRFRGESLRDPVPMMGALSGAANSAIKPSRVENLLPTELAVVNRGLQPQDVQKNGKEQSSQLEDLKKYAEKANAYLRRIDTHLEFQVSEQTGRMVISVVDSETSEVLRQIPPETMRDVSDHITLMRGLLFSVSG